MKVHLLDAYFTWQVLVTGTQDIGEARKAAEADRVAGEYMEDKPEGRVVRGITIPQPSDREFSWVWMEREGGRVKAVIFDGD
jgi:hypothetical protein